MKKNKKVTVKEYASLCGVSVSAILHRIAKKRMKATSVKCGSMRVWLIDAETYPPKRLNSGRPPFVPKFY